MDSDNIDTTPRKYSNLEDQLEDDLEYPEEAQAQVDRRRAKKRKRDSSDEGDQENQKKQKLIKGHRAWFFTWNTTVEEHSSLLGMKYLRKYAFQVETSGTGTRHYQGLLVFSKKIKFQKLKKLLSEVHWEVPRNKAACGEYVTKLATRTGPMWVKGFNTKGTRDVKKSKKKTKTVLLEEEEDEPLEDPMDGLEPYNYQKLILKIIKGKPDKRLIYWFWSDKGGIGKSSFCKHIIMKHNATVVGGSFKDAFYAIQKIRQARKMPKIIVFDLPRSMGNKITYVALEKIKDGFFFSSKYESGQVTFNVPHVIVFANMAPQEHMVSLDRWKNSIFCLDKEVDLRHVKPMYDFVRRPTSSSMFKR